MSTLTDKYTKLLDAARKANIKNLSVSEQNNVLHITGTASQAAKDQLWDVYNQIDPDMRAGDMVLDLTVDSTLKSDSEYEVKKGDNLSKIAAHYPGITWQKIYDANKDVIKDPNDIYPGQKLRIPTA